MVPDISCFAWPTRDRPEALERGLGAWGALLAGREIAPAIVVADDSDSRAEESRRVVEAFASSYPGPVHHLDRHARRRMAQALSAADAEAAAFALGFPPDSSPCSPAFALKRYGVQRNFLALLLAGRRFAVSDDDVLPEFREFRDVLPGVFEGGSAYPMTLCPHEGAGRLEEVSCPVPGLAHEYWSFLDAVEGSKEAGGARIAALCYGSWGDSGMSSSRYLLTLRASVAEASYAEEAYEGALLNRELFRAAPGFIVGGRYLVPMHAAFDGRVLLPPFTPTGRGEDVLWARLLELLHPDLSIAYPPPAVRHSPLEPRVNTRAEALEWSPALHEFLWDHYRMPRQPDVSDAEAYATLGASLEGLLEGPRKRLEDFFAASRLEAAAQRIGQLEAALEAYGREPPWWASDVEDAIEKIRAEAPGKDRLVPPELLGSLDVAADYLGRFGRLMTSWPALHSAALAIGPALLEEARVPSSS